MPETVEPKKMDPYLVVFPSGAVRGSYSTKSKADKAQDKHGFRIVHVVEVDETQIVVNRQSLLRIVRALDLGATQQRNIPAALDDLREPFFPDEMSSGIARTDNSMNSYDL